ncbi:MAG: hypothetical protein QOI57_241 [Rubrobacteraceae bacterium]|nr:hypothetical protein [Rubrobacteraceae bacterium]
MNNERPTPLFYLLPPRRESNPPLQAHADKRFAQVLIRAASTYRTTKTAFTTPVAHALSRAITGFADQDTVRHDLAALTIALCQTALAKRLVALPILATDFKDRVAAFNCHTEYAPAGTRTVRLSHHKL